MGRNMAKNSSIQGSTLSADPDCEEESAIMLGGYRGRSYRCGSGEMVEGSEQYESKETAKCQGRMAKDRQQYVVHYIGLSVTLEPFQRSSC